MNFSLQEQKESVFTEPTLTGQPEQQTTQSEHQNTTPTSDIDRQMDEQKYHTHYYYYYYYYY